MLCILLVPEDVDGVGSARHTDGVFVSKALLVLPKKRAVTSLLTHALENVFLLRLYRVGDQDGRQKAVELLVSSNLQVFVLGNEFLRV